MHIVHGWPEVKTFRRKIASTRECSNATTSDNVLVPVPNVDRAKIDHPNLLAVVMEEKAEGLYRLGTRSAA